MSERLYPWRSRPPQVVVEMLQAMPNTVLYLVARTGPTSFVVREDWSDIKRKVLIGARPSCSCALPGGPTPAELCLHLLFVLVKVLRVPASNPLVWQLSLTDRELEEVLRCGLLPDRPAHDERPVGRSKTAGSQAGSTPGQVKRKELDEEEPCPICYEDMAGLAPEFMVWCRYGCGSNVHGKCMNIWAEHQTKALGKELSCPLCRTAWGEFSWRAPPPPRKKLDAARQQLLQACVHLGTRCAACKKSPLVGQRYRCLICLDLDLCTDCFQGGHHPQHPFAVKDSPSASALPASRDAFAPLITRLGGGSRPGGEAAAGGAGSRPGPVQVGEVLGGALGPGEEQGGWGRPGGAVQQQAGPQATPHGSGVTGGAARSHPRPPHQPPPSAPRSTAQPLASELQLGVQGQSGLHGSAAAAPPPAQQDVPQPLAGRRSRPSPTAAAAAAAELRAAQAAAAMAVPAAVEEVGGPPHACMAPAWRPSSGTSTNPGPLLPPPNLPAPSSAPAAAQSLAQPPAPWPSSSLPTSPQARGAVAYAGLCRGRGAGRQQGQGHAAHPGALLRAELGLRGPQAAGLQAQGAAPGAAAEGSGSQQGPLVLLEGRSCQQHAARAVQHTAAADLLVGGGEWGGGLQPPVPRPGPGRRARGPPCLLLPALGPARTKQPAPPGVSAAPDLGLLCLAGMALGGGEGGRAGQAAWGVGVVGEVLGGGGGRLGLPPLPSGPGHEGSQARGSAGKRPCRAHSEGRQRLAGLGWGGPLAGAGHCPTVDQAGWAPRGGGMGVPDGRVELKVGGSCGMGVHGGAIAGGPRLGLGLEVRGGAAAGARQVEVGLPGAITSGWGPPAQHQPPPLQGMPAVPGISQGSRGGQQQEAVQLAALCSGAGVRPRSAACAGACVGGSRGQEQGPGPGQQGPLQPGHSGGRGLEEGQGSCPELGGGRSRWSAPPSSLGPGGSKPGSGVPGATASWPSSPGGTGGRLAGADPALMPALAPPPPALGPEAVLAREASQTAGSSWSAAGPGPPLYQALGHAGHAASSQGHQAWSSLYDNPVFNCRMSLAAD